MRTAFLLLGVSLAVSQLHAATWFVGGSDGQFDEIQPAIDAAAPGDVILVRATKKYRGFVLDKGVTIRASSSRFQLADGAVAEIVAIDAAQAARVGGIEALNDEVRVYVHECEGEVALEDIDLRNDLFHHPYPMIAVLRCARVHMTGVTAIGGQCLEEPAIRIARSQVQLTSVLIEGGTNCCHGCGFDGDGVPGSPGIAIDLFSRVVLANPTVTGGSGSGTLDGCHHSCAQGGRGGPGLLVQGSSEVLVLGLSAHRIAGGQGGKGGCSNPFGCLADGGDGGPGIRNVDSQITVSGVQLIGGTPGGNNPCFSCDSPSQGPKYEGLVSFIDPPLATLQMLGPLDPGSSFSLIMTGAFDSSVLVLFSPLRGWIDLPAGYVGAPWTALPGQWFVGMQAGKMPGSGELTLILTLPADPVLRGLAITAQAVLFLPPTPTQLTNGATGIIGE